MDIDQVEEITRVLCGRDARPTVNGEWANMSCPFAPRLHDSGRDANPSFGLHFGADTYFCFSCHSRGRMPDLPDHLEEVLECDADIMFHGLRELVIEVERPPSFAYRDPDEHHGEEYDDPEHQRVLSHDELYGFESAAAHWYLKKRRITATTINKLRLRLDPNDRGVERILFPVMGRNGDLFGFTGRATELDDQPRIRDYKGLQKSRNLLGMQAIENWMEQVILVEGLFDFARLFQYGFPVLAIMGSSLSQQQAQLLKYLGRPTYLFLDNDKAGRTGARKAAEMIAEHVPTYRVRYPTLTTGRVIGDPDGLFNPDMVHYMMSTARLV